jgi:hypothetical protein
MKRQIISTLILLIATAAITVLYFKNLNPPGANTSRVMAAIPGDAPVVFQFTNEKSFYDIFINDTLIINVIGRQKLTDIDSLRTGLLSNLLLSKYFEGQSLFISLHPLKNKDADLLLTMQAAKGFDISIIAQLAKQPNTGLIINPLHAPGVKGFEIYINTLKKRFYIVDKGGNIFSGSFSEELALQSAAYKPKSGEHDFVMLSAQQTSNSLATIYVNNMQLTPLFAALFNDNNIDIFRSFRQLPAQAALSLNYRTDALMLSGITTIMANQPESYLNVFTAQRPVENHLKDIFPATTAYSINLSVSDPSKFGADLYKFHNKAGLQQEQDSLFKKIKAETGVSLRTEFINLLGNEFALVTTRFREKYAIIEVRDGLKLSPLMMNISTMATDKIGQFNYSKLPFFLLGDAFSILKKPYFMIVDNYLILATSENELTSYYDTYFNRKFLSKMEQYNQFDNLLSERSNVAFFFNFKNAEPILKMDLNPAFYSSFNENDPGWKNFYGASYQYSAADKNFYTNFCMRLSKIDTAATGNVP